MQRSYAGGTAVVTGGASGIGFGMAAAFARHGMNVVLADIQDEALEDAAARLRAAGARVVAVRTDVSDAASVDALAAAAVRAFGKVHVIANNAGVAFHGTDLADIGLRDWEWVIGVNLYGVVHGIRSFVPLIREHGERGHVVNTASVAGFRVSPGLKHGAYAMTKHAVVALTEALTFELEGTNVAVSMLCPGAVNSSLDASARHRPARFGGAHERPQQGFLREFMAEGLTPQEAGERALEGMLANEFIIFTGTASRAWIEGRQALVSEAFERIAGRDLSPRARR